MVSARSTGSAGSEPFSSDVGPERLASNVLLYVPNMVGYLRLVLLACAWWIATSQQVLTSALLFFASILLDGVDGHLARYLNQASSFGAFLDVWIDNLTRGLLWSLGLPHGLAVIPVVLEMTTFLATHKGGGAAWKEGCFRNAPPWVMWLMSNGLRTPQGAVIAAGLFGAPTWCWLHKWVHWALPGHPFDHPVLGAALLACRAVAAAVEVWVCVRHVRGLLEEDSPAARATARSGN